MKKTRKQTEGEETEFSYELLKETDTISKAKVLKNKMKYKELVKRFGELEIRGYSHEKIMEILKIDAEKITLIACDYHLSIEPKGSVFYKAYKKIKKSFY